MGSRRPSHPHRLSHPHRPSHFHQVAKGYDFASKEYVCPIGTSPPSPPPSPPPAVASPVSGPSWGPAESIAPVPAPTQVSPSIQLSDGLCGELVCSWVRQWGWGACLNCRAWPVGHANRSHGGCLSMACSPLHGSDH